MPTAAHLVAALILAAVGWFASELVKPVIEAATGRSAFPRLAIVNLVIGALAGWVVIGKRAGRGVSAAIGNGITGVATLVFWALFVQAAAEMVNRALARRYDGPMEAIAGVFELFVDYAAFLGDGQVLTALAAGALVAGLGAEFAARRWR
ncbi:tellurium resistance protein [Rhodosalinus sediminis]|uniref:Tellurium resistance protein n=1 Tax=Rhodosalinus sediminis TaxID=1940533 RepID=A0A3D9BYD7_9RHOB|nr:TrgA family protein [Rhodosalinus sediminis]REC58508.1 tellurium resistance protein [Rhodosalinus sediminis]